MFDLLFKFMKKINFSFITEHYYDKYKFDPKLKKDFFNFYTYVKSLFDLHKINFDQKRLLDLFWKKIIKLSFQEKSELIKNNFFITHFLNKNEFKKYVEKFSKDWNWWMFAATFNKEYKKLNVDISNKSFSLSQVGRFMLNNENVKTKFIKKLLNKITIQDFYVLDGTYLSWKEFIILIEKSELDVKKYLLDLAKKNDWIGCKTIIDGLARLDKNDFKKFEIDKTFEKKLHKIKDELFKKNKQSKEFEFKVEIPREEIIKEYKKIHNIYQLFNLPPKINNNKFPLLSLVKQKSMDINYDTSQVDQYYFLVFDLNMNFGYDFYKEYFDWVDKEKKKILIARGQNNVNLTRMNELLIQWIIEKDLEISGFLALKFLKESILLLFPNKKEYFKKNNFYRATREAAKTFEDEIKWTNEILFAPTNFFKQARNKICHFDIKDPTINFAIICLAMHYFLKWLKKIQKLNID